MNKSNRLPKHEPDGAPKNGLRRPQVLHPAGRRSDEGTAFLPDPYDGAGAPARTGDDLAQSLAEEFVVSATTAEDMTEDDRNAVSAEELGGPFTQTTAAEEFATEPDDSNPIDGEKEPFPTATRQPG
jgi:hypothetical protein